MSYQARSGKFYYASISTLSPDFKVILAAVGQNAFLSSSILDLECGT